jgi:hypothetical protein
LKLPAKTNTSPKTVDSIENTQALLALVQKRRKELNNLLARIDDSKAAVLDRLLPLETEYVVLLRKYIVALVDWWNHSKLKPGETSLLRSVIGLAYTRYAVYESADEQIIALANMVGVLNELPIGVNPASRKSPKPKTKGQLNIDGNNTPSQPESRIARKLFLDLAKKFHPDKTTNEKVHPHQTAMMQRINEAYGNNDTFVLMDLHQKLVSTDPSSLPITAEHEAHLRKMLKEQADELQHQIMFAKKEPSNQLFLYFADGSTDVQNHKLWLEVSRMTERNAQLADDVAATQWDAKSFVRFLKEVINRG